ncbi:tetraacyldisaccharide 4'-kinase [Acetobacter senegalensis]|uniref:Tetraacyldisaccharide 4'-kinase n=1 Tax=Acetobacter senegalensis TaxID=446692 RepID=A0A0U5F4W8_9PROT|nr:tetraacyldisaccharide 4'-kinase [Acetobacter senegalensis]CEF42904.1 tetraacyldisaccharide 4'-kinase [Acetobacter senegalensis]
MIHPPRFWQNPEAKWLPFVLSPIAAVVSAWADNRQAKKGWKAPIPVLCCGNITTGGTGKTTVVLDLVKRLQNRKIAVHALIRGYGGKVKVTTRVDPARHTISDVGDEALLLATHCPTWVGGDRVASARAAISAGAQCLIMDDGFQNPGLHKDVSLLSVDGIVGLGNGHVLPAGPLRERAQKALARASAVLLIGLDRTGFLARYKRELTACGPVLRAALQPNRADIAALKDAPCVAFAGLGRPSKFFEGLSEAGVMLSQSLAFPDHYFYKARDMERLITLAEQDGAQLVTTPKDAVRLPASFRSRVQVVGVGLKWDDEIAPERLLDRLFSSGTTR